VSDVFLYSFIALLVKLTCLDIIEGVHDSTENGISLHSSDGCTIAGSDQTAKLQTTNCFYKENFNSGCGSLLEEKNIPNNYGKPLNDNGGGVYATEWTTNYIKHWFFPRGSIPISISSGAPNVSDFGRPAVNQQGSCKLDEHFGNMSIIINTDFCGDWAGEVYANYPNCPQNPAISSSRNRCVDFVGNNPQAFKEAYWDLNSIRVYQMPVGIVPTSSYSTSLATSQAEASTNTIDAGMGRTSSSLSSLSYMGPLSSLTSTPAVSSASESGKETSTTSYELPDESGFFTDVSSTLSPVFSTPASTPELPDESGFFTDVSSTLSPVFTTPDSSTTRPELPDESGFFTERSPTPSPVFSTPYPSASPGAGPGAACPGVDKQLVTAADGRTYRVYCSSETTGNGAFDSKIIAKGTYNQCFEYCTRELECTAFTWAEFNTNDGGECYFKKEGQTPRAGNSNLISVILVTGDSGDPPPTGSGSGSASTGATPSTSRAPSPTPRFNCVDGSLQAGPAGRAYNIFCNSDTTGGAFASQLFSNGTYSQCIDLCDATSGCGAWTWGPYSTTLDAGGNCFLKMGSQTRSPSDKPGTVGGSLFGNTPPPSSTTCSRITVVAPSPSASASESASLTVPVLESPISSSSGKPSSTAVPCPAANGTEYVSSSGKVYEIICGVDQESDPSSSFYAMGDYTLCVAECEKELGCVSITYSSFGPGQGFCYFRKSVGRLVATDDSDTHLNLLPGRFSSMSSLATSSATTASSSRGVVSSSISMSASISLSSGSSGTSPIPSSLSSATSGKGSSSATESATTASLTAIPASSLSATGPSFGVTAASTTSLTSGTSSSASISTISSASASALPPGNTPQCGQVFTDPSGVSYQIFCSTDSSEGSFRTAPVYSGGYGSCFGVCDSTQGCGGFTYVGEQSGNCYLKSRPGTFSSTTSNFVSAFKVDILGYASTSMRPYSSISNSLVVSSSVSSLAASSSIPNGTLSSSGLAISSTSIAGSSSSSTSSSSASVSYAPLSPCPTSSSYYCMEDNQQTTCASNGNNYAIQYGIAYEGVEIDTSDINDMYPLSSALSSPSSSPSSTAAVPSPSAVMIEVLPKTSSTAPAPAPSATQSEESDDSGTGGLSGPGPADPVESDDTDDDMLGMEGMSMLAKRATVPDVQSCRNLCDRTSGCKAFNFVGTDCTLFSSVSGYSYAPGAVAGTVYGQGEAPPTPIDTSPVCPGSAGKTFTDGMNVTYDIVCYTQYERTYIPIPPINSNNLANCLPDCDRNELCAGVSYDTTGRQCRLLSAFDGTQRGDYNFIAAIRVGGPPAYSASSSSSLPPTTVTTTLGPVTTICKLVSICSLTGRQLTFSFQHSLPVRSSRLLTRLSTL
jgi:hypothetical protein